MQNYTIETLRENLKNIYTIHYACGNFYLEQKDEQRITVIVIIDNDDKSHLFSLKRSSELLDIELNSNNFNLLEKHMLDCFYKFVASSINDNQNIIWLNWRMSTNKFGFEVLEHRYKVLHNSFPEECSIRKTSRLDIVNILNKRYGTTFADDPKMKNLMLLNSKELHRNFLDGKEEVEKYRKLQFNDLQTSTEFKTFWIKKIYRLIVEKKLKTKTFCKEITIKQIVDNYYLRAFLIIVALITFVYNFFIKV